MVLCIALGCMTVSGEWIDSSNPLAVRLCHACLLVCECISICFGLPRDSQTWQRFKVSVFVYIPLAVCRPPPRTDREQESHTGLRHHDSARPHTHSPRRACSLQCSSAVQRCTYPHTLCHTLGLTQTCSFSNALPLDTLQQEKDLIS